MIQIVNNFHPEKKSMDMLALKSIFGEHVDEAKIPSIRAEFESMLHEAHSKMIE